MSRAFVFDHFLFVDGRRLAIGTRYSVVDLRKEHRGVGSVSNISMETFNVCRGQVSFTTDRAESIVTSLKLPCVSLDTTGRSIDVCYNWNNPYIVAYNNKLGEDSECSDTGHNAAKRMVVAAVVLLVILLIYIVIMCTLCCSCSKRHRKRGVEFTGLRSGSKVSDSDLVC